MRFAVWTKGDEMAVERRLLRLAVLAAAVVSACGDSGPASLVGSSDVPSRESSPGNLSFAPSGELGLEDFDCTHVESVHVRFSSPGYVEDDRVGLFVSFEGIPEGPKRIRLWWDYENDAVHFRDFVYPVDATDIEEIYEHRYLNLPGPTEMLVRVELIRDGLTGNCPRNRRVVVAPPEGNSAGRGPARQTASVGPKIGRVDGYDFFSYFDGVRFTVFTALTIDSVWVDPGASGTLSISLWDSSGSTLLAATSVAVSPGPQQVGVGFSLPPGDYLLTLDGTTIGFPGVGTTSSFGAASYPYQIPGVISLTDSASGFGAIFGWYYFLYDWQVSW
jgi:hypothetical protein